jgi:hypothetical protein
MKLGHPLLSPKKRNNRTLKQMMIRKLMINRRPKKLRKTRRRKRSRLRLIVQRPPRSSPRLYHQLRLLKGLRDLILGK